MEDKIWNCIIKRLTGSETEASEQALNSWMEEDASHAQQYREACSLWSLTGEVRHIQSDTRVLELIKDRKAPASEKVAGIRAIWKYGIAASLIVLFSVAAIFQYRNGNFKQDQVKEWVVKKAGPGKMILVEMPDGSKIWLNADSEIRFLKSFSQEKTRSVILNGEAYFDVSHDAAHPFVVKSAELTTTVYGTSFNVRAYSNEEETSVTVNSGKVGVTSGKEGGNARMLLPQDKLTYGDGKFTKTTVLAEADGWTRGDLVFDQTPLDEVFETISRKYNVKIAEAKTLRYQDCRLTARFRNQSLVAVLKTLKLAMNINSKQTGTTIYLEGGAVCSSNTK
ncbi:FecR family protein [Pedobacter psychroterrae]|uniref:FecR family protein n=1 Tax=Pedobacter psychroterrae TaxID=2530453 RepID=A0A4R0NK58_9SPHI|nr:FecR family protein [Pedobacter psychroterrae]TCD01130.1 FecR family protein [Pedobacter psychroterrae]